MHTMPPSLWLKLLLLQASKCYLGVCVCIKLQLVSAQNSLLSPSTTLVGVFHRVHKLQSGVYQCVH